MGRRRQRRRSDARRSDPRQLTGAAGVKIAVLKETVEGERRVAATPETVKKFIALGAEMAVERGAGASASIADADFEAARSEERRVGKQWVSTFRSRWSPNHSNKTKHRNQISEIYQ